MTASEYLSRFPQHDIDHIVEIVNIVDACVARRMPNEVGVGVIAFGSTTDNPLKRVPDDIDLRILNSAATGSEARRQAVQTITEEMAKVLQIRKISFEKYDESTAHRIRHESLEPETVELGRRKIKLTKAACPSFIDYDNNDPSIVVRYGGNSRPIHICVSGVDQLALEEHLREEVKHKTMAVQLL